MRHDKAKRTEVLEAIAGGMPQTHAAEKFGVPLGTVNGWFRKFGREPKKKVVVRRKTKAEILATVSKLNRAALIDETEESAEALERLAAEEAARARARLAADQAEARTMIQKKLESDRKERHTTTNRIVELLLPLSKESRSRVLKAAETVLELLDESDASVHVLPREVSA